MPTSSKVAKKVINEVENVVPDDSLEVAAGDPEAELTALRSVKRKTVTGAISYMARTLVLHGISLVTAAVLAAFLSAKDFGIYGIVTQVIGLLTFFADIGLGSALIQKRETPSTVEYRTVFTIQQLLSGAIFLISLGLVISNVFTAKIGVDGNWVLLALALSFPLATLKTIPSLILERKLEFGRLVVPQLAEQLVYNGILVALAMSGFGVQAYAWAILTRSLIGVAIMTWMQPWPFGWSLDLKAVRLLLGEGVKFQLNDFLARIKDQLFFFALGMYLPTEQFGYISFSKTFSQLPYQLTVQNVIAITFPTYARLQHHPDLLRRAIERTIFFISLAIFPMLVGMIVFIGPLIHLIPRYEKWLPAIPVFTYFTLSLVWSAVSTPLTNTLNAIGKINVTLKLMIMWTVLTWVLTPAFVWWWGFTGVGFATFVISFSSVMTLYYVQQIVKLDFWDQLWRQGLAAAAMAMVGWLGQSWWSSGWIWLITGGVVTVVVYGSALLVVGFHKLQHEVLSLRS